MYRSAPAPGVLPYRSSLVTKIGNVASSVVMRREELLTLDIEKVKTTLHQPWGALMQRPESWRHDMTRNLNLQSKQLLPGPNVAYHWAPEKIYISSTSFPPRIHSKGHLALCPSFTEGHSSVQDVRLHENINPWRKHLKYKCYVNPRIVITHFLL